MQKNVPPQVQYIFILPVVILFLIWWAYRQTQVTIDNEGLTYKSIFSTRQLSWSHVRKVYTRYQQHGKSGTDYWYFELPEGSMRFSFGLFSRKSVRSIAEAITQKCRHADIQDRILKMAEGRHPPSLF